MKTKLKASETRYVGGYVAEKGDINGYTLHQIREIVVDIAKEKGWKLADLAETLRPSQAYDNCMVLQVIHLPTGEIYSVAM